MTFYSTYTQSFGWVLYYTDREYLPEHIKKVDKKWFKIIKSFPY
jgi:hypothetical protein